MHDWLSGPGDESRPLPATVPVAEFDAAGKLTRVVEVLSKLGLVSKF